MTGAIIDTSSPDSFSHTYTATAQIGEKAYAYGPFVVPAGSEPIDIDLTVPAGTVAGGAVSISDSWSASILAAEEGAEAAGPAVLQAQAAAAEAAASAAQAQAIALSEVSEAQGAVFKVQSTPPENATEGGLPVVWIDTTEQFVPTPVNPPTLAWDDALSRFTVPTGVIGVEYVWTSGGGGVGATLMPGATLSTSGAYPRTVTVTPVAKLGYVLASGVVSFVHDFPDPSAVTVMTSDGFGGSADPDITGRVADLGLGGTLTPSWVDAAAWNVDGAGRAVASGVTSGIGRLVLAPAMRNLRVELEVTTLAEDFDLSVRGPSRVEGKPLGYVELALGPSSVGLRVANGAGGGAEVGPGSGATLVPQAGLWVIQIYVTTVTITDPASHVRVWDLSDSTKFDPGSLRDGPREIWMRKNSAGTGTVIDSIKMSKVGF
ncbi:hypothetical protein [Microbacterium esteraromaticum]|uniref:hypothetical protein n=1 Tax=Microbacterium esteraromaticum TaxID=57043 RepID=UPI00195B2661|nr:hypothetical protein [Microbacterium esteraromaticum]MBM7467331.1 hypothetical protein [Microbacterium esteraromaticum]